MISFDLELLIKYLVVTCEDSSLHQEALVLNCIFSCGLRLVGVMAGAPSNSYLFVVALTGKLQHSFCFDLIMIVCHSQSLDLKIHKSW